MCHVDYEIQDWCLLHSYKNICDCKGLCVCHEALIDFLSYRNTANGYWYRGAR